MKGIREHTVKLIEGIRVQEIPSCLLCRSEGMLLYQNLRDRLFGAPGTWTIMRCPKCGLVWLNPQPVPEDVGKLYENYFTHDHDIGDRIARFAGLRSAIQDAILTSYFGYKGLASGRLQKFLGKVLSWIGPIKEIVDLDVMTLERTPKGKLLDVGCGNGYFLANMRDLGWEVYGVELDGQAVKVARERLGLEVYEGTLEEIGFPGDTFDAITMDHVIEHVPDPISTLKECQRVLKKSGKLVVTTPNIESLGHRLFGEAWRGLEVPRHLCLFSSSTLRGCTERAGLRVAELWTTSRSARWVWAASYLIRRNGVLPGGLPLKQSLWLRLEGLAFQAMEYGLCWIKDAGEEIVLITTS